MRISVVYLLMVFLLAACTQEPERTDVIDVPVNDPELNAATEKARAELHRFIDHIEAYPEDDSAQMKIPRRGIIESQELTSAFFKSR